MAKRFKMNKRASKRSFTRNAMRVNRKNIGPQFVMRGGIRL